MTARRHLRPSDRVSTSDIAKKSLCNVGEDSELDLHSDGDFKEMEVYSVDNFCDNTLPSPSPISSVANILPILVQYWYFLAFGVTTFTNSLSI